MNLHALRDSYYQSQIEFRSYFVLALVVILIATGFIGMIFLCATVNNNRRFCVYVLQIPITRFAWTETVCVARAVPAAAATKRNRTVAISDKTETKRSKRFALESDSLVIWSIYITMRWQLRVMMVIGRCDARRQKKKKIVRTENVVCPGRCVCDAPTCVTAALF